MKNFVVGLLSNRFGIVLAALNVCYFVSTNMIHVVAEHNHGEGKCVIFYAGILTRLTRGSAELMMNINSPALILSFFPSKFMQIAFHDLCFFTQAKFQIVFILFFVTFQWLFIAHLARLIAGKIQAIRG